MKSLSNKYYYNEPDNKKHKRGKIIPITGYNDEGLESKFDSFINSGDNKDLLDYLYFVLVAVLIACIIHIIYLVLFWNRIKSGIAAIGHFIKTGFNINKFI